MREIIKKTVFVFIIVIALGGSAWGGWFSFEPNVVILDGTPVARELEDIQKETLYQEKGDVAGEQQLIADLKVSIVKNENKGTPVKYVSYEEHEGRIFVRIEDESGSKLWANMLGIAFEGQDGKERRVTKLDLEKGEFGPLSNAAR